jgi:hypothetical protein
MKRGMFTTAIGIGILLVVGSLTGCGEETQIAAASNCPPVVTANGPPARPLQTAQTTCYDASGNTGNTIPCAGTGQDGATQTGVAHRYIDNGDGTISDRQTGLMWEKKSWDDSIHNQFSEYTWSDAFTVFIAGLDRTSFAGHSDWRLPNINELQSVADYGTGYPAIDPVFETDPGPGGNCGVITCSYTQPNYYWSSTTSVYDPTLAWTVHFSGGQVILSTKVTTSYVRAVRGGL